jgi:hypothetical protein
VCALSQFGGTRYALDGNLTKLRFGRQVFWRSCRGKWNTILVKTFIAGVLLGIALLVAALYFVPVVDQYREVSMITVKPNDGNAESFHVNIPMDRIMNAASEQKALVPAEMEWPSDDKFSGVRAELFKVRNSKDAVVGVASRISAERDAGGSIIEWVLHLPARGSIYVSMQPQSAEGGYRIGQLLSGTREFSSLQGSVMERWVTDTSGIEGAPAGRIELQTQLVAQAELQ